MSHCGTFFLSLASFLVIQHGNTVNINTLDLMVLLRVERRVSVDASLKESSQDGGKRYGSIVEEEGGASLINPSQAGTTHNNAFSWAIILLLVATAATFLLSFDPHKILPAKLSILPLFQPHQCIFTNVVCANEEEECFVSPLEYETCLSSISLNPEQVLQTISSLDDIFRQYYPFYDMARNPTNSSASFPNATYQIYNRHYDLHAQLKQIQSHIQSTRSASISTFFQVTAAFNLLRDAHVHAIQGNIGNLSLDFFSGRYSLIVRSKSDWEDIKSNNGKENDKQQMQTRFYYGHGGRIEMDIIEHGKTRKVVTINGRSVHDFVLSLAESPLSNIAFKSVGPRVNALTTRNFPSVEPADWLFRTQRLENIWPHLIVPEMFVVEFECGDEETFLSKIILSSIDRRRSDETALLALHHGNMILNTREIAQRANRPSNIYQHFMLGAKLVQKHGERLEKKWRAQSYLQTREMAKLPSTTSRNATSLKDEIKKTSVNIKDVCILFEDTWFDKAYNCSNFAPPYEEDGPLEAAFKVLEDVVIFKLDSFDAPPELFIALWTEIVTVAKNEDVNHLLIDISNNGGGEVPAGLNLARLMYPEVNCEYFENAYDMVYNDPMRIWATIVNPMLTAVEAKWKDHFSKDKWKALMKRRGDIISLAKGMCILDLDHSSEYNGDVERAVVDCSLYNAAIDSTRNHHYLDNFITEYLALMRKSNPWTVAIEAADVPVQISERQHKRGGTVANFTGFLPHEPDYPNYWKCSGMDVASFENPFLSYVLVGNGNSGSTANTFQTTVENIWKHRYLSEAMRPLVTVSYGGIANDTPLTSYAGGTVVGRTNVEAPYVGLAGLHLLSKLIGDDDKEMSETTSEAIHALETSLPAVPYYLQQFSKLPAFEIYNHFNLDSAGEAIPQEFVNMPPDIYLEEFFFGSIFGTDKGENVERLYEEATKYFQ